MSASGGARTGPRRPRGRGRVAAVAGLLLGWACTLPALATSAAPTPSAAAAGSAARPDPRLSSGPYDRVARVQGGDRVATAVDVSRFRFPGGASGQEPPEAAVLVRSDDFADALAAAPLAAAEGPLLLTSRDRLDPATAQELRRVLPAGRTVHLLGGPGVLGGEVERAVRELGFPVRRLAGEDRYATAVAVARYLAPAAPGGCEFVLATGRDFPDAVVGAGWARPQRPVLLTDGERVPAATAREIERCGAGVVPEPGRHAVRVSLFGDPAARAYSQARAGSPALRTLSTGATRCSGPDRYVTATLVCDPYSQYPPFPSGRDDRAVALVSGQDWPDALLAATLTESVDQATGAVTPVRVVFTRPGSLPEFVAGYLHGARADIGRGFVVGGPGAVSPDVERRFVELIS
ncbi:hypothetical protein NUM3379_39220 [Kineococcus sp. NUM-3379]